MLLSTNVFYVAAMLNLVQDLAQLEAAGHAKQVSLLNTCTDTQYDSHLVCRQKTHPEHHRVK